MKVRIVGWDKDGVLSDASHRQWMVPEIKEGRKTWGDFAAACKEDPPIEASIRLMRMLEPPFYYHVVMSGSTECPEGRDWLDDHRVPYSRAMFRRDGDLTDSGLLKSRWINELQDSGNEVEIFFEDVPEIAEVIRRETGVKVMVVNPCYGSVRSL